MTRLGQFSVTGRRAPGRRDVGGAGRYRRMTVAPAGATGRTGLAFSRSVSTRAPGSTVRVPLMAPGHPQPARLVYRRSAGRQPRVTRINRPIGQEREPNYSGVQSGSLSPLRAAPLEEAGNGGRSVAHIPSAPRVQTHRRHRPPVPAARSRPLRQLSPAPQRGASPEALPPRAWSLPRQLFPPARMSKRRDVPIRVFMPFLGVRTVGCPAWARCSVSVTCRTN
jgi:hypothetical protein